MRLRLDETIGGSTFAQSTHESTSLRETSLDLLCASTKGFIPGLQILVCMCINANVTGTTPRARADGRDKFVSDRTLSFLLSSGLLSF